MEILIINETTLNGCYALSQDPNISNPVALNFASVMLVEESISRNSGLYQTLIKYDEQFYQYHKSHYKSMLYSLIIYSPKNF